MAKNGKWLPREHSSWTRLEHNCDTPRKYFAKSNRWQCGECEQVWALGVQTSFDGVGLNYTRKWVELDLVEADLVSNWCEI